MRIVPATRRPYQRTCVADDSQPSWIFRRSTYTHDPETGARVAQYMRTPPVEPLDDERIVTSRYRRSRTNLRGTDGSIDTYYEVQAWGNGRGGIDAEWERFHDAWKESYLQNGFYNQNGHVWNGTVGTATAGTGTAWNGDGLEWRLERRWSLERRTEIGAAGNGGPMARGSNNGGPHGNGGPQRRPARSIMATTESAIRTLAARTAAIGRPTPRFQFFCDV